MRKYFIFLIISISSSFIFLPQTYAEDVYNTYIHTFDSYRNLYTAFITARDEYDSYNTPASESRAILATRDMLVARAQVFSSYVAYLQSAILPDTYLEESEKQLLTGYFTGDYEFFTNHGQTCREIDTIDKSIVLSELLENQSDIFRFHVEQIMLYKKLARVRQLEQRYADALTIMNEYIQSKQERMNASTQQTINRLAQSSKSKYEFAQKDIPLITTSISTLPDKPAKYEFAIRDIEKRFTAVVDGLSEGNSYMQEIIRIGTSI